VKKLRTLIVDDEKPARARLTRMLEPFAELEIVGEAQDGVTALELASQLKPDIVFLDIEMPELDGLGVARSLGLEGPHIVFVTAYDEYALKAFETNAIDYLVKPVSDERLQSAIQKVLKRSRQPQGLEAVLEQLNRTADAKFAVKSGAKFVVCDPAKISAIIARDHYSAILTEGRELLADDPLEHFEKKLTASRFIRVHRSAIVNLDHVLELEREGDRKYLAVLSDSKKTRVPISREKLDLVKARLGLA
jgi:DNA-binding LytR/AlgR family response regulator